MNDQDLFSLFNNFSYSIPNEKGWKVNNVFGKIEGYLDNRDPGEGFASGCLPQWSIKFTKKAIVRISYDCSGPRIQHGIYLFKRNGLKADVLFDNDDGARIAILVLMELNMK